MDCIFVFSLHFIDKASNQHIRVSPLQDSCTEAHSPDHTGAGLVVTESSPEAEAEEEDNKVDVMAKLFEKLFNLNKKLEEQEDDIFRFKVNVQ